MDKKHFDRLVRGLRETEQRRAAHGARNDKPRLPVFEGRGGLVAGVDPTSNKALLAALGDDA